MSLTLPFVAAPVPVLDEPLSLPPDPAPVPRPSVPVLATLVPVLGAVILWMVTGSVFSLWFAFLGPVIAGATLLDGMRTARRGRRRALAETDAARARLADAVDARHDHERELRRARHPDVAHYAGAPAEVWRAVPGRSGALAVGTGDAPSALQLAGGGADDASIALRRRARVLPQSPLLVEAVGGIAVMGTPVLAGAVARALVLQACLANPPGDLRITGPLRPADAWVEGLPHRAATTGTALAIVGPGDAIPPDAEVAIVRCDPASPVPPQCGAIVAVSTPGRATLDAGGSVCELAIEGVSLAQAEHFAAQLSLRARALPGSSPEPEAIVALGPLLADAPAGGLSAVIGLEGAGPACVDLLTDGPHAVVSGMTGSGKSELLITWILALCASRSPREVSFLLADFKGGTAFDSLAVLPHVTGVITDLDGAGARRAIESLRAEVRWREAQLARAGARDILDDRVDLPRLVVVVDEFAALLGDHPELHAVFTDIAARGRALGMHLILGTQRVAGVVRDALLANCPLRISLRVADAADSRAVIGAEDAARLPSGPSGRGVAFLRRAGDAAPRRVRVALSDPGDPMAIAATADAHRPRRPWLPQLPRQIALSDLPHGGESGALLLGLADEPDLQRQVSVGVRTSERGLLVVGAAGTGKSTALRTLTAQAEGAVFVSPDLEVAWDAVAALAEVAPARGTVVVIDDLDALVGRFPHDYATEWAHRLERLVRDAGDLGVFVAASAQRLTGASSRIGDLLPRRVVLGAASRAEYIGMGGDAAHYASDAPPGRGRLDGRAVQIAVADGTPPPQATEPNAWFPGPGITGFAARRSSATRSVVAAWQERGIRVVRVADAAQALSAREPAVIVGDAEDWQRNWQLLSAVRSDHTLVIDTSVAADFRALSADRALPPYCSPGRSRAWLCHDGLPAVRIALPSPVTT